jgi:hypothetical protein
MESHTASHRRSWGALHARECEQTYRVRLGEFRQGNATHGHAGEVEAILSRAAAALDDFVTAKTKRCPIGL